MKASIYPSTPSGEAIAEALSGKRVGPDRWMANCCTPGHDDRSPSLSIRDTGERVLVHCFGGCPQDEVIDALRALGLWPEPGMQTVKRRGPTIAELEREGIKHMVAGTLPARWPPYTRELPRTGRVSILIAADEWPRRPVPALVLPPGHPPGAYRWPVAHRPVDLIDLDDNPPPGYFHYGRLPWLADPWQWREVRRRFLRAFAYLLLSDYGAASVRVVGSADRVVYEGRRTNAA